MSVQGAISSAVEDFKKAISHLKEEYSRLQAGRASAALVEGIKVDVYGSMMPLKGVATITIPDARTIQIQPWDKSNLVPIEKAIVGVGLGFNPTNDGHVVRIVIPQLTEERRKDLVKVIKKLAEDARIAIRNARQTAHNAFKELEKKSEITEDDYFVADKDLQKQVDEFNKKVADLAESKEKDVMTV